MLETSTLSRSVMTMKEEDGTASSGGTEVYCGGRLQDFDKFVPKDLTPRMVPRRQALFFNPAGEFSSILVGQSLFYRKTAKVPEDCDVPISMDLRQNFELKEGGHSCHLVIGKSLLGNEDSSIPKEELEPLTMASNLCWAVRQTLEICRILHP